MKSILRLYRALYDWVVGLAEKTWAEFALWGLSFAEASFLPIPVDPLLLAMGASRPSRAVRFAFGVTIFSVLGGLFGWLLGHYLGDAAVTEIAAFWGKEDALVSAREMYTEHGPIILFVSAVTPVPFIAFTLIGGIMGQPLALFLPVAFCGRALRFMTEGFLLRKYGSSIVTWMDKWFDRLAIIATVVIVGGFLLWQSFSGHAS